MQKADELVELFRVLKDTDLEDWQNLLLQAAERIAYWGYYIKTDTNLDSKIKGLSVDQYSALWRTSLPAVELLLSSANLNTYSKNVSKEIEFLFELNNELSMNVDLSYDKQDPNKIMREIYQLLQINKYFIIAVLALFDVHLDRFIESRYGEIQARRPLELLRDVFLPIVEGLHVWSLRTRWINIYYQNRYSSKLQEIIDSCEQNRSQRVNISQGIIHDFVNQFGDTDFEIRQYDLSPADISLLNLPAEDKANLISMKVICPDIPSCYRVESWLEERGRVIPKFIRKTLYFPEENGTRRLQTGIRLEDNDYIVVVRIGTNENHKHNLWGRLINTDERISSERGIENLLPSPGDIVVYNLAGDTIYLECGSTLGDFIIDQYSIEEARHVIDTYINASVVTSMSHKLEDHDVVRVIIDKEYRKLLSLDKWNGAHKLKTTYDAIAEIKRGEDLEALQGKNRISLLLQQYLSERGFALNQDILFTLLNQVGFSISRVNQNRIFAEISADTSKDQKILEVAFQYYLHESIREMDGARPSYNWGEVQLATCCQTIHKNEPIVGTEDVGPKDPANPRYGQQKVLRIHRKNCKQGPKKNILELKWATDEQVQNTIWGIKCNILLDPDYEGSLTEILNFIQNELRLKVYYAHADAINYGPKQAHITLSVSAISELDRDIAISRLSAKFGHNSSSFVRLTLQESRELMQRQDCPYITNTDPEVTKYTPLLFVGRNREMNRLKSNITNPNIHQIMIVGYYRNGKTWMLKHFMDTCNLPDRIPIFLSLDVPPASFSPENIIGDIYRRSLARIADQLSLDYNWRRRIERPKNWWELALFFKKMYETTKFRFILLIDEFSGVNEWIASKLVISDFPKQFKQFMNDASAWVDFVLVFQAADYYDLVDNSADFVQWFRGRSQETIDISPFSKEELDEFLLEPPKDKYALTEEAVDIAMSLTGGNPFISALLGKNIWHYANKTNHKDIDVNILKKIYENEIIDHPDWDAYINRLVEKLSGTPMVALNLIAEKQIDPEISFTKQWNQKRWISELEIMRASPCVTRILLEKLNTTTLIEKKIINSEPYWRIKSQLLANYLLEFSRT